MPTTAMDMYFDHIDRLQAVVEAAKKYSRDAKWQLTQFESGEELTKAIEAWNKMQMEEK